jgi:hypothetical protein
MKKTKATIALTVALCGCRSLDLDPNKGPGAKTRTRWPDGNAPTNAVSGPSLPSREPPPEHWFVR